MLRTSAIGLACAVALSLCTAAPAAAAMHGGGGGGGIGGGGISHGGGGGGIGGGGISHGGGGGGIGGGGIGRGGPGPGSMIGHGSGSGLSSGIRSNMATLHDRDFGRRFDRDHDFDRDRDRFRFRRFFPGFGFDTYSDIDVYPYEDCYVLHRVWTRSGLRLRRIWVCG